MEHIPPGKSGDWEGVPKYYHSLIHWRDNKDWECTNIQLFIDQLTAIDPSKLRLESTLVLETLVHFAKTCVESKERLFILQDWICPKSSPWKPATAQVQISSWLSISKQLSVNAQSSPPTPNFPILLSMIRRARLPFLFKPLQLTTKMAFQPPIKICCWREDISQLTNEKWITKIFTGDMKERQRSSSPDETIKEKFSRK